jgi:Tol biopolymer transport system component
VDFGQQPMPSPDGTLLAFATEGTATHTAGIYILTGGAVTQLTAGSPPHSWDYVWSGDSKYLAFSAPGAMGTENAGIWMIDVVTLEMRQLWDRGSSPSWDPDDSNVLYCAGPEDGTENEGIFRISRTPSTRIRIAEQGRAPIASPDGKRVAFQAEQTSLPGWALHVLRLDSLSDQVVAFFTSGFSWSWDSQQMIYECMEGGIDLYTVSAVSHPIRHLLIDEASMPAPYLNENRVAFVRLSGSSAAGIWTIPVTGGEPEQMTGTGTRPRPTSDGTRIYFEDDDGIYITSQVR